MIEMATRDITLPVRRMLHTGHHLIREYPYVFIISVSLSLVYKIFPSLFFLFLSHTPVFALTFLMLIALLYYGEKDPNFQGIKERELIRDSSEINMECKSIEDTLFRKKPKLNKEINELGIKDSSSAKSYSEKNNSEDILSRKEPKFNEEIKYLGTKDSSFAKSYSEKNNFDDSLSRKESKLNEEIKESEIKYSSFAKSYSEKNNFGIKDSPFAENNSQNYNSGTSSSDSESESENNRVYETERFRRLTSLIQRRRARMSVRHEIKKTLVDPESETQIPDSPCFRINLSSPNKLNLDEVFIPVSVPGSAPSVLLHQSPFEPVWNRNGLTGSKRFSRLDSSLVTESDSVNDEESSEMDLTNDLSIDKINDHGNDRDLEEISENKEGGNANSYSDRLLLSEYLNLCSSEITQPTKETKTLIETAVEESVETTPDTIKCEENKEISEFESVKEVNSILQEIRAESENISASTGQTGQKDEPNLVEMGPVEPEMVVSSSEENDEHDSVETGQAGRTESEMKKEIDETGSSESAEAIREENGSSSNETGQTGLKWWPLSNSNLKKLRKQYKAVETDSSSSDSD